MLEGRESDVHPAYTPSWRDVAASEIDGGRGRRKCGEEKLPYSVEIQWIQPGVNGVKRAWRKGSGAGGGRWRRLGRADAGTGPRRPASASAPRASSAPSFGRAETGSLSPEVGRCRRGSRGGPLGLSSGRSHGEGPPGSASSRAEHARALRGPEVRLFLSVLENGSFIWEPCADLIILLVLVAPLQGHGRGRQQRGWALWLGVIAPASRRQVSRSVNVT